MNPKVWEYFKSVGLPVCKDCKPKIVEHLDNGNRMPRRVGQCDTTGGIHISMESIVGLSIEGYYSHSRGKWFFTNDQRRALLRKLRELKSV